MIEPSLYEVFEELQWLVVSIWSVFRTVKTVSILENLREAGHLFLFKFS